MIGKTIRHLAVGAASLLAGTGAALAGKANDTFVWTTSTEIGPPDLYYGNQREVLIIAYAQCDSLLHRDPVSNDYKPLLAETWTWLDPTTLELTLRKGVKFHDGREFGAQDVADTLNHVARPDSGMQIRVIVDWIKNVEVVAPDKVRIHAKAPTPAALDFLSGTTPIYPRGHYESAPAVPAPDGKTRRDWGAVKPICTGPYILKDHKAGQSVTLTKNPNYFAGSPKGKPQIGTIVYRTIKDAETQVAELLTGGVAWIWGVPPENAKQLGAMPNVVVKSAATMRMSFLSLDAAGRTGDTPLKDVRVRRAIFHAIDTARRSRRTSSAKAQRSRNRSACRSSSAARPKCRIIPTIRQRRRRFSPRPATRTCRSPSTPIATGPIQRRCSTICVKPASSRS